MNFINELNQLASRRAFLARSSTGLGALALSSLLNGNLFGAEKKIIAAKGNGVLPQLHHPAKAKRIIYLFQSGSAVAH